MTDDTQIPTQAEIDAYIHTMANRHGGRLTPEMVLTDAKRKDSPLHAYFEWNNAKAAHQWRLEQARTLIRSVTYTFNVEDRRVTSVAYVRDPTRPAREQGYIAVDRVRTESDMTRDILIREFTNIGGALQRVKALGLAFELEQEVEKFTRNVEITLAQIKNPDTRLAA